MSEDEKETTKTPEVETKVETDEVKVAKTFTEDEVKQIEEDREHWKKSYQTIQRTIAERDTELKRLREQPPSSATPFYRNLITTLEKQQPQSDEFGNVKPSPQLASLKAQVAQMEFQEKRQQAFKQIEGEIQKIKREAEEAGIDPLSKEFDTVVNAFKFNDIPEARRRAERLIKEYQGSKEQKVEGKGKTEEEIRAEIEAKVKADFLSKYKVDVSVPSGGNKSGLKGVLGSAQNPREAREALDKFVKGG